VQYRLPFFEFSLDVYLKVVIAPSKVDKDRIVRQVILIPDETGGYVVEVPSLPGCYSQGETEAEALENIKEAIELHIEDMIAAGEEVPPDVPAPILLNAV
jgi:predicted RNase H-like HicB family nuclease